MGFSHAGYTLCNYGYTLLASPLAAKGVFSISADGIELESWGPLS